MSKRTGVSAEEKLTRMIGFFHSTVRCIPILSVFHLKPDCLASFWLETSEQFFYYQRFAKGMLLSKW